VGGLAAEEAIAALMERFQPELELRVIEYNVNGTVALTKTFADFGARYDFSSHVTTALQYRETINIPRRFMRIFGRSSNIGDPAPVLFNAERMESILCELSSQIDRPPKNAAFMLENGIINITPEAVGAGIDINTASEVTKNILNSAQSGTVNLTLSDFSPLYTVSDLNFPVSVLGSFYTALADDATSPRLYNVRLASDRLNNQTIYPGGVLSASEIIAANVPNSGYKAAIVLVRGEPVEDVGGGVCQVVTTLYNAVLLAELEVVQRHNHSSLVSYVGYGFDATVAGDYFDLKFKNSTEHPILVTSAVLNGRLEISIHGLESRPPEREIRFAANRVDIISPGDYREVVDAALPVGARLVVSESQMGYKYELVKHVYVNGREVEQVVVNTSTYKALQGVIAVGAG